MKIIMHTFLCNILDGYVIGFDRILIKTEVQIVKNNGANHTRCIKKDPG